MLSVFITPWTKPTSIHRATSDACAATTPRTAPGMAARRSAASGWWRSMAWSTSRRSRSTSPVARAYWKRADAQVAARHPRQHGPRQDGLALDPPAGRDDGQRPGGRDAQGVHRLADDVLAQHRTDRGQAVAAAGERRAARSLEVQVAQRPSRRAARRAGARGRRRGAASSRRTGARRRPAPPGVAPSGTRLPTRNRTPSGLRSSARVEPELCGQRLVEHEQPGLRDRRRLPRETPARAARGRSGRPG